jgi:arsenite-transporting ATPase
MTPSEPVGIQDLTALAQSVFGGVDPLATSASSPAMVVAVVGDGYRLSLPLPNVDRADVELARSGDDLVVTLGSLRRRIALPSVLRRCSATGAELVGEDLRIEFRPDPARWPAALTDDGVPRLAAGGTR